MLQASLSSLARGIPAQLQQKLCVLGQRSGGTERVGEEQGAEQGMQGHGRTTERQREAELWQKQGQRWAEAQRELESGARMALPPSRD